MASQVVDRSGSSTCRGRTGPRTPTPFSVIDQRQSRGTRRAAAQQLGAAAGVDLPVHRGARAAARHVADGIRHRPSTAVCRAVLAGRRADATHVRGRVVVTPSTSIGAAIIARSPHGRGRRANGARSAATRRGTRRAGRVEEEPVVQPVDAAGDVDVRRAVVRRRDGVEVERDAHLRGAAAAHARRQSVGEQQWCTAATAARGSVARARARRRVARNAEHHGSFERRPSLPGRRAPSTTVAYRRTACRGRPAAGVLEVLRQIPVVSVTHGRAGRQQRVVDSV